MPWTSFSSLSMVLVDCACFISAEIFDLEWFVQEFFDNSGSIRAVYDMSRGVFPTDSQGLSNYLASLKLEHIRMYIELSQLANATDGQYYFYSTPKARQVRKTSRMKWIPILKVIIFKGCGSRIDFQVRFGRVFGNERSGSEIWNDEWVSAIFFAVVFERGQCWKFPRNPACRSPRILPQQVLERNLNFWWMFFKTDVFVVSMEKVLIFRHFLDWIRL